jgi:hypothetical protein
MQVCGLRDKIKEKNEKQGNIACHMEKGPNSLSTREKANYGFPKAPNVSLMDLTQHNSSLAK